MPNPLNMPVILTGTPFVEQTHQQIVQQGETGVRAGILRVDQLIDQERSEVQQLLPSDNPAIQEKAGGNPRRRRRRRKEPPETAPAGERRKAAVEPSGPDVEGKGGRLDIEA